MPAYATILSAIAPVFLILGLGAIFQKSGFLSDEIETGVMRLVINLLAPCLIFTKIAANPDLKQISIAAWSIGLGLAVVFCGFAIAFLAAQVFRLKRGHGLRTFTIATGIQNYGFIPLPIIMELWPGEEGPLGLVFVHGLGVEMALWTVGIFIMSRQTGPAWRKMINAPFVAVVVSLTLNYTGGHALVPGIFKTAMEWLGACSIPMALFMIGATIGRLLERAVWTDAGRTAVASCLVRLAVMPAVILSAAYFFPLPEDLRKVLVIQAAMPAAIFPIVVARLYGGHPQTAIQVIMTTTIASIFSAPLVIALGLKWLAIPWGG